MSSGGLLVIAMVVFGLMITGLFISMNEFLDASDDPSLMRDDDSKG